MQRLIVSRLALSVANQLVSSVFDTLWRVFFRTLMSCMVEGLARSNSELKDKESGLGVSSSCIGDGDWLRKKTEQEKEQRHQNLSDHDNTSLLSLNFS